MEGAGGKYGGRGERKGLEGGKRSEDEEQGEGWRVAFWNVAGVKNKDSDFWRRLGGWEVVVMTETWIEEKDWERLKEKLPKEFVWKLQMAKRRNRKGRAIGGILLGVKKNLTMVGVEEEGEEGRIVCKIKMEEEMWRIVGLYVNGDMEKKLEGIMEWMEEGEEGIKTIIGGDFNARTGLEGGWRGEESEEEVKGRRSKDKKMNREGKMLVECLEKRGWSILNGSAIGDEEGEFTYTGGRRETVIDYILGNGEIRDRMERLEVGEEVDSDHHPVILWMKGKERGSEERRGGAGIIRRGTWDEEGRKEFRRGLGIIREEGKEIQQEMEEMGGRIKKTLEVCEEQRGYGKRIRRKWWDEECRERKKEVRKELRRWRREGGEGDRYRERKRGYKEMCEEKKKEERERMLREAGEAKTEGEVWEIVRRERKRWKRVSEEIKIEEWKEYFMGLLGGVEGRVVRGRKERREKQGEGDREEDLEWEEVKRIIEGLKDGKAIGQDGISNEVWKYGGEGIKRWVWGLCKRVWRGMAGRMEGGVDSANS